MLRIIGGEQRGRKIDVPDGLGVRPTTDRVREAIFNLLRRLIEKRPAFDLFAGSGALGLEALSRGAARAWFLESDRRVATVLEKNIRHLYYDDRATVVTADVFRWAERFARWPAEPAIVFIAPPYAYFRDRLPDLQTLWATLVAKTADDTAIVMQAPRRFEQGTMPPGADWELRRYGETTVVIGQTCRTSNDNSPSTS